MWAVLPSTTCLIVQWRPNERTSVCIVWMMRTVRSVILTRPWNFSVPPVPRQHRGAPRLHSHISRRSMEILHRPASRKKGCCRSCCICRSSGWDCASGFEWGSRSAVRFDGRFSVRRHVQGALGHVAEWGPPDPARQVSKVRISSDDDGGDPRHLERWVLLWACLVMCQVGCVWLTRESESRGDSHACHAPDESRVHGVHEVELPRHSIVGIQSSWHVCARKDLQVWKLGKFTRTDFW